MGLGRVARRPGHRRPSQPELVLRLRTLPLGPLPDPVFRSELRTQLVAITPRLVTEPAPGGRTAATPAARIAGRVRARRVRRPLAALTAAAAVILAIFAGVAWKSGSALPGDPLYGMKRAGEDVRLTVARGDADAGHTYLELARTRLDEVSGLLHRSAADRPVAASGAGPVAAGTGRLSAHTAALVARTLDAADSESRSGIRLLGRVTVRTLSADALGTLGRWADDQRGRLADIAARVPAGVLTDRVASSQALLDRIDGRGAALRAEAGCGCLSTNRSDDLGPLPCSPCNAQTPPGSTAVPTSGGTTNTPSTTGGSTAGGSPATAGGRGGATTSGSGGAGIGGAAGSLLPGHLGDLPGPSGLLPSGSALPTTPTLPAGSSPPTLPRVPTGSLPVTAGSTGVGVTLPGLSIGVGRGGVSVSAPLLPSVSVPGLIGAS